MKALESSRFLIFQCITDACDFEEYEMETDGRRKIVQVSAIPGWIQSGRI